MGTRRLQEPFVECEECFSGWEIAHLWSGQRCSTLWFEGGPKDWMKEVKSFAECAGWHRSSCCRQRWDMQIMHMSMCSTSHFGVKTANSAHYLLTIWSMTKSTNLTTPSRWSLKDLDLSFLICFICCFSNNIVTFLRIKTKFDSSLVKPIFWLDCRLKWRKKYL